jgi:hypothetical protein
MVSHIFFYAWSSGPASMTCNCEGLREGGEIFLAKYHGKGQLVMLKWLYWCINRKNKKGTPLQS